MHIIHVNGRTIHRNAISGTDFPIIACMTSDEPRAMPTGNVYGHTVDLHVGGELVGRFVYDADNPLPCGARVWCELYDSVEVKVTNNGPNRNQGRSTQS
jgi:hypothetical protein